MTEPGKGMGGKRRGGEGEKGREEKGKGEKGKRGPWFHSGPREELSNSYLLYTSEIFI